MNEVAVVFGTRPEVIKLGGLVSALGDSAWTVHSGQHWDDNLVGSFLRDLGIGTPDVDLALHGRTRGPLLGEAVAGLSELFEHHRPQVVVVQGDTTTALAGALAANACDVALLHVEAGLRSFDRAMPEEHHRVVIDHLADRCAVPTAIARQNLLGEGIAPERIVLTGNTVVEAVQRLLPPFGQRMSLLHDLWLKPAGFVLASFHRPENVDGGRLAVILEQLQRLTQAGWPVVLPLHPRTRARVAEYSLSRQLEGLLVCDPLDYKTFLGLSAECALLVSDSGGVQEEASVLKRPMVVVRASTERPEVLGTFTHRVEAGPDVASLALNLLERIDTVHQALALEPSPFGDGRASCRCLDVVNELRGLPSETGTQRGAGSPSSH